MSNLFDKTTNALGTALNMRKLKHDVVSGNIANTETPDYHAKKMDFEEALARAVDLDKARSLSASRPEHFPVSGNALSAVGPEIYENPDGVVNNDGNTVDLEKEMSSLAENSIMYKAALQLINKKLAAIKYAISEGR